MPAANEINLEKINGSEDSCLSATVSVALKSMYCCRRPAPCWLFLCRVVLLVVTNLRCFFCESLRDYAVILKPTREALDPKATAACTALRDVFEEVVV